MDKARIAIASVLKPLTEPRAYSKLALSLRETNKYHLNIIGFCSKKTPNIQDVRFTCIFNRHRTHFSRALAPFKFLVELFTYRPQLLIVTTYELLPMALLGKLFLKFKLVYDLQENYHKNVLLNKTTPKGIRPLLALSIRMVENSAHPFIDRYFFAERSYPLEFPHIKEYTLLENKYQEKVRFHPSRVRDEKKITFIISGTITEVYGIEKAIHWFLALQRDIPGICLKITGHVPLQKFKNHLEDWACKYPSIKLNLSSFPLPYLVLQQEILDADVVLLPYENIDSIQTKIPTKLYESIALKKPILISANPLWQEIMGIYPAGLSIDFFRFSEAKNHFKKLMATPLYVIEPGQEVTWESEKLKLIKVVEHLLS